LLALLDIVSDTERKRAYTAKSKPNQREGTSESEVPLRDPGDGERLHAESVLKRRRHIVILPKRA